MLLLDERVAELARRAVLLSDLAVEDPRVAPQEVEADLVAVPRTTTNRSARLEDPIDRRELGSEVAEALERVRLDALPPDARILA